MKTTTRSKRWNGKLDTLAAEYLKEVLKQMESYGERVRFSLALGGVRPYYQVINATDKKIAFDSNHHLYHPEPVDFTGEGVSQNFSDEQIQTVANGGRLPGSRPSVTRTSAGSSARTRTPTVAMQKQDDINALKYAYYKENRHLLPDEIGQHSNEITKLMQSGITAADAFGQILEKYFP